jgi:TRAP-type mannitol/chloroaromatic compound transport system permease small subunit
MIRIAELIDDLNEWVGRTVSWLTLFMVIITFAVVLLRSAFDLGWIAMQETVSYMHAVVFLCGAAFTLKHEGHVRVDVLLHKFSPRGRLWVDFLGTLLLLLPVCGFMIWMSWDYVLQSWSVHEVSGETGGLEGLYLLKSIILLMALLLLLQGVAIAIRRLLALRGAAGDINTGVGGL